MFLPAPALDDTRWTDLVEEGRALIPLYAPDWTDHNLSDPGITFSELFAWLAEMQIFEIDQVPARHRLKFLALVGITPRPPMPARTIVRFAIPAGAPPLELPRTIECEGVSSAGAQVGFRTTRSLHVVSAQVQRIQGAGVDYTARWRRGEPFTPFGDDPHPGAALLLALDAALPTGVPATVAVSCATAGAGAGERERLEQVAARRRSGCRPPDSLTECDPPPPASTPPSPPCDEAVPLAHHSAQLAWEILGASGGWRTLDPAADEVVDETRALTLNGHVQLVAPEAMEAVDDGGAQRFQLRVRLARGSYDEPPLLRDVALNGVGAEQSVPAAERFRIAPGATIVGAPTAGAVAHFGVELITDAQGVAIGRLDVTDPSAPPVLVLGFVAPAGGQAGELIVEAVVAGRGDGRPEQSIQLATAPLDADSVRLWTGHGSTWQRWAARRDLDASGPADAVFVLDPTAGVVQFGDGLHGLAPRPGELILAAYRTTAAEQGDVPAGALDRLTDDDHNRALLPAAAAALQVTNPVPAAGGAEAETLEHAEGRAGELTTLPTRAVTLGDYEQLAVETPGARLARVYAVANLHPDFLCVSATGVITVVIVPFLPRGRPAPSAGLVRAVTAYLDRHRIVGTRVEVTGPTYTEMHVQAEVLAARLADPVSLKTRVLAALDLLFDPLSGGRDGTGWPFGRDVVRTEVLQAIEDVTGVDHVLGLELIGSDGASCGNLCIGPLGLVAASAHQIEVVSA